MKGRLLSGHFVPHLLVPLQLLVEDLVLQVLLLLLLPLVENVELVVVQLDVRFLVLVLVVLLGVLLLNLAVELGLHLLLKLLLADPFQLALLLVQLGVKLNERGPFVVFVPVHHVDGFGCLVIDLSVILWRRTQNARRAAGG